MKRNLSIPHSKGRRIISGVLIGLFLMTGVAVYTAAKRLNSADSATHFLPFKTWISDRQNSFHQTLAKVQRFTPPPDTERPIHFKFYTTLPTMQFPVSGQLADDANQPTAKLMPIKNLSVVTSERMKPIVIPGQKILSLPIANAQELERELAQRLNKINYTLQLGVFRTQVSAQTYRHTLSSVGFNANIIVIAKGKSPVYRLQLGPYANKKQAKIAQQQLQRKGLKSLILTSN